MPPLNHKARLQLVAGKCVLGGDCLAIHEGKTCFLEGTIPGETVEAAITQEKKDYLRARVTRVVKASPSRISPICPHVKLCGGCQYQHVSYQEELQLKEFQVRETIQKATGVDGTIVEAVQRGPKEFGYRRSVTFHIARGGPKKTPFYTYIGKDNKTPVFLKQCGLLDPSLQKLLQVPISDRTKDEKITFKVGENGQVVSDQKELFFRVKLSGETLLASAQGFFQNNWEVTEKMVACIKDWVLGDLPETFFDLYAGVGLFSFLCARPVPKVYCVEESKKAVVAMRMNREERSWEGMKITEGRVEKVFPDLWRSHGSDRGVVLLDPPRQGLEKNLCEFIRTEVTAKKLIYVSCDPATLARDLKLLLSEGRWKLARVVPFDMFPRTKHVEAAALLVL